MPAVARVAIPQEANAWSRLGTALLGLDRYEALVAQLRAVKLPGSRTARAQRSLDCSVTVSSWPAFRTAPSGLLARSKLGLEPKDSPAAYFSLGMALGRNEFNAAQPSVKPPRWRLRMLHAMRLQGGTRGYDAYARLRSPPAHGIRQQGSTWTSNRMRKVLACVMTPCYLLLDTMLLTA